MRRFNAKLFFGLVFGTLLLVALTFLVHWLQTGRIARALLAQADRAEQDGHLDEAARYLGRYLELEPDNIDARARLGQALSDDTVAVNRKVRTRALFVLDQVLAKLPQRRDLRLRLVHMALALDRRDVAREHLQRLTQDQPDDGESDYLLGQLAEAEKAWEQAAKWYRLAVQHAPQQVDAYPRLADVLRRRFPEDKERTAEADQVMNQLIAANQGAYQAYLARWRYRQQWSNLADGDRQLEASGDVVSALKLAPNNADVLIAAAELAQTQKKPEEAGQYLLRGRQLYPQDVRMYREMAWLELREATRQTDADKRLHYRQKAIDVLRDGATALRGEARSEMLWMQANVLIEDHDTARAKLVIAEMAKANGGQASVDYLQARIHVLDGHWSEARRLLERSLPELASSPDVARQADLLLAQCCQNLNDAQGELDAYRRMVDRDPNSLAGLLGKAAAQMAQGQVADALQLYQQASRLPDAPGEVWVEVARLTVLRALQSANPDWRLAEDALRKAAAKNPDALDVQLLRVELLVAQSRTNQGRPAPDHPKLLQAQQLLEEARRAHPERVETWAALAGVLDLRNHADEAVRVFDDAAKQVDSPAKLRRARIQFWVRRGGKEAAANLDKLAGDVDKVSGTEQGQLLADLGEGYLRLGDFTTAQRYWERLVQRPENRNDLRLRLLLFDVALQSGKETVLQQMVTDIQRIEGPSGIYWRYCKAVTLINKARKGPDQPGLDEARNLLNTVVTQRAAWPAPLIALADLEALKGNTEGAIANYRAAIELGERQPRVVRQLVELLYKQQRFEEADKAISSLQQAPTGDLKRLQVAIDLQSDRPGRAVAQAREAVAEDSTDYRDHLWLGQVLAASGTQLDEAEKHLRRAVELAGDQRETWVILIHFLAAAGKKSEADAVIAQAQAKLPGAEVPLTLALAYEALGQLDQAREQYQKAMAARPGDAFAVHCAAAYYLRRGDVAQAEPILRLLIDNKVKAKPADQGWARRSLAFALAVAGDNHRFGDALTLVGLKSAGGAIVEVPSFTTDDAVEELRTRVRILARQPRQENRRKAIALLEDLEKRQKLTADDQFILAQLFEVDGNWPRARDLLQQATTQGKNPAHMNYYAQALLRRKELAEVERIANRLARLETERKVEAGSLGSVELRAQLLEAQGQGTRALQLLTDYVNRKGERGDPERIFALILSLGRLKRYPEALKLCEQARATCPPERVAGTTVGLLRAAQAKEDQCAPVAAWLTGEINRAGKPKALPLILQLADLEDLRGRYVEAEKCYRDVLAIDEHNVVALNNLAWLLAQQKPDKSAEALALINRAIEKMGTQPDLLDTRASVYLAQNQSARAIADLEAANADRPDPMRYFHLAQAQRLANNTQAAASLLKKATASGLKAEQMHPVERVAFLKLLQEMDQQR